MRILKTGVSFLIAGLGVLTTIGSVSAQGHFRYFTTIQDNVGRGPNAEMSFYTVTPISQSSPISTGSSINLLSVTPASTFGLIDYGIVTTTTNYNISLSVQATDSFGNSLGDFVAHDVSTTVKGAFTNYASGITVSTDPTVPRNMIFNSGDKALSVAIQTSDSEQFTDSDTGDSQEVLTGTVLDGEFVGEFLTPEPGPIAFVGSAIAAGAFTFLRRRFGKKKSA